jgi:hypothetical protein
VELDLQSTSNKEMLRSILDTAGQADVVFEGEFFGLGAPDPNLPEAIRKSYQHSWGQLGAFRTKLVVHAIHSLEPVPGDHAAKADVSHEVPILQGAALPVYPPIGQAAHITGKVVVELTVSGGKVASTEVKSGSRYLAGGTEANVKTWRFADDVNDTFTVMYTYAISGEETDGPTNPTVEMLPSLDVKITARPVKPAVTYGVQASPSLHEPAHAQGTSAP